MFLSILVFAGTMALSLWATLRVKAAYAKYSRLPAASGYSGAESAEQILQAKQLLAVMGFIRPGQEARAVAKVLDAAAWTYVAAFLTSLAYFPLHLLPLLSGGKRSEE
jgi:Zn-dependent membrane protease YugP